MNVYDLSRRFWDFAFENPDIIKPNHTALYFFAIEHCNRLGWKEKFGFPTSMAMEAVGIKSYNTFIKCLNDLVEYGFLLMVKKSSNQYSSNIIALSKIDEANNEALDKALIKHSTKQVESTIQSTSESTVQSIDSINKPIYNNTNIPINNILLEKETKEENIIKENFDSEFFPEKEIETDTGPAEEKEKKVAAKKEKTQPPDLDTFLDAGREIYQNELKLDFSLYEFALKAKYNSWIDAGWKDGHKKPIQGWKNKLRNVIPHLKPIYGKSNHNNSNNGYSNRTGNTSMGQGGKISAATLLAERASKQTSGNGYGGNFTTET